MWTVTVTEKVGFRNTLYALVLRTAVYVFCCLSRMPILYNYCLKCPPRLNIQRLGTRAKSGEGNNYCVS